MRYMIIVRSPIARRGAGPSRDDAVRTAMARYHRELACAGVLLDASALQPLCKGWRVSYGAAGRRIVDGPTAEDKEPMSGYALIEVRSRGEALEWSRRFPDPGGDHGTEIEVFELFDRDDLERGAPLEHFRYADAPCALH